MQQGSRFSIASSYDEDKSVDNNLSNKNGKTEDGTIDVNELLRKAEAEGKTEAESLMDVLEATDVQVIGILDDDMKYRCHICYKGYKTSRALQQHMVTHSNKQAEHKCKTCDKSFHFASNLRCHELIHTDTKNYECDQCEKTFNLFNELKTHKEEYHSAAGDRLCPKCPKRFHTNGQLNNHMRVHDENPVKCEVCNKVFSQNYNLMVHMRTHTGEKPFKCETCHKCFAQAATLYYHRRLHTGERPYKCKICGDSFHQVTRLRFHVRKHEENDYLAPPEKVRILSTDKRNKNIPKEKKVSSDSETENEVLTIPRSETKMEFINPDDTEDSVEWETRNNPEIETESDDESVDGDVELDVNNLFHVYFVYKCKLCSAKLRKIKSIEKHIIMHKNESA